MHCRRHWLRLRGVKLLRTSRVFLSFINKLDPRSDHLSCCTLLVLERALVSIEETTAGAQASLRYSSVSVLERRMRGFGVKVSHRMIIYLSFDTG